MRIISGEFKGRRFQAPDNLPARPTTDAAKESLFNILGNHLEWEDLNVLDLFAGIGSISLEFVSRGAAHIHAVDSHMGCVKFIQSMAQKFEMNSLQVFKQDAFDYLKKSRFSYNLVFADPPYQLENIAQIPDLVLGADCLVNDGFFILEHSDKYRFTQDPRCIEERRYGKVHFSFFRKITP